MTALTSVLKSGQDMKINTTQYEQRETPHLFNIQWYITVCTIAPTIYKKIRNISEIASHASSSTLANMIRSSEKNKCKI